MQIPTWDNPVGTDGFEFIEYTAPDPKALDTCSNGWVSPRSRAIATRT